MTTPNRGQGKKDGYEVLYDAFKQTQAPRKSLSQEPTEAEAKVVEVILKTDPNVESDFTYYILARRTKEDRSVPEPEFYEKSYIKDENIVGLKKYYPVSEELEMPQVGQAIRVSYRSGESTEGIYLGPLLKSMKKTDLVGSAKAQTGENAASKTFGDKT